MAAGLRDPAYWRGDLKPRPTVDWYLNKIAAAVEQAKRATDGAPITLLAHSVCGWGCCYGGVSMLSTQPVRGTVLPIHITCRGPVHAASHRRCEHRATAPHSAVRCNHVLCWY